MVKQTVPRAMVLSTEWAQVEVIDLINDGNGLGFNIVGGRSTGVVIKYVIPGSVADKDARLQSGDHVLQVGAVNLRGFSSDQVASVLRQSGSQVRLLVARPVDPTSSDFRFLGHHAPIVPTKILSDPEQLDRHLVENGYNEIYNAIPQCYEEQFNENDSTPESHLPFPIAAFVDIVGKNPQPIGEPPLGIKLPSPVITFSTPISVMQLPSPPEMEVIKVLLSKNVYGLGVTVAGYVCEKEELSGIFVKSIIDGSAAELSGKIKINDRIIEVDGVSLTGITNPKAVEILRNTSISVSLVLERYLRGPKYEHLQSALWREDSPPSPPSPSVATLSWFQVQTDNAESTIEMEPESHTTVDSTILEPEEEVEPGPETIDKELDAQIDFDTNYQEKWGEQIGDDKDIIVADIHKLSGLGISLEGTVDVEGGQELRPHHYIRSILPQGPVGLHGALQAGDELLQVNEHCLHGLKHTEVVTILKELPSKVRLVCARSSIDMGPRPLINMSQDREGFETRKIISGSLHNIAAALIKSHSDGSINTSSTATLTDHSLSKKSHSLECVSNLAMWNDEEVIVDVAKGEQGLGFSILDYQDPIDPEGTVIVVRSLVPGGVAEKQAQVAPGDRLLSVNGLSIRNVTLDQAVHALKSAPLGTVSLGIARPLPSTEHCSKSLRNSISGSLTTKVSS